MPAHQSYDDGRDDVLDLLREVRSWRLPSSEWAAVRAAVRAAGETHDRVERWRALDDLERRCPDPVRGVAIGDPATVPPPEEVIDEVNELIHRVASDPAPEET